MLKKCLKTKDFAFGDFEFTFCCVMMNLFTTVFVSLLNL